MGGDQEDREGRRKREGGGRSELKHSSGLGLSQAVGQMRQTELPHACGTIRLSQRTQEPFQVPLVLPFNMMQTNCHDLHTHNTHSTKRHRVTFFSDAEQVF